MTKDIAEVVSVSFFGFYIYAGIYNIEVTYSHVAASHSPCLLGMKHNTAIHLGDIYGSGLGSSTNCRL